MAAPDPTTLRLIETLVGFDTVSRHSNRRFIEFVRDYLAGHGVDSTLFEAPEGDKVNLFATIGPAETGGLMLAGHSDVVPVEGQDWNTDPFRVTERDGRLYGRGTCDMKGFIAVALALVPELVESPPGLPVYLAFTYDEEVGCFGARELVARLADMPVRPAFCVVGEPTGMGVINGHKGKLSVDCEVRGLERHSAYVNEGVNAVEMAAELIAFLRRRQRRLRDDGPHDERFAPPYTTIQTGIVRGGIARNIVPRDCRFEFEMRNLPGDDPTEILGELRAYAENELLPEMRAVSGEAGFSFDVQSEIPALRPVDDSDLLGIALGLTGENRPGQVSFATEGGLYQESGIPTVVCGPGHIAQAHRPDEFVDLDQIATCESFLRRLIATLAKT